MVVPKRPFQSQENRKQKSKCLCALGQMFVSVKNIPRHHGCKYKRLCSQLHQSAIHTECDQIVGHFYWCIAIQQRYRCEDKTQHGRDGCIKMFNTSRNFHLRWFKFINSGGGDFIKYRIHLHNNHISLIVHSLKKFDFN